MNFFQYIEIQFVLRRKHCLATEINFNAVKGNKTQVHCMDRTANSGVLEQVVYIVTIVL
jgi:hypothetical protein